jgi:hypothetical protein
VSRLKETIVTIRPVGTAAWWLPLALAAIAAAGFALDLTWLPRTATALAVFAALITLRSIPERLVISAEGLRVRWLARTRTIPWDKVFRLDEVGGFLGPRWHLRDVDGQTVTLPAMRGRPSKRYEAGVEALLAAALAAGVKTVLRRSGGRRALPVFSLVMAMVCLLALVAERPWRWIPGSEFATAPPPCDVVREVYPDAPLSPANIDIGPDSIVACEHSDASSLVRVSFVLAKRDGIISGWGRAADLYGELEQTARRHANMGAFFAGRPFEFHGVVIAGPEDAPFDHTVFPGVGDEAIMLAGPSAAVVYARVSNLLIVVAIASNDPENEALWLARRAVAAVNV